MELERRPAVHIGSTYRPDLPQYSIAKSLAGRKILSLSADSCCMHHKLSCVITTAAQLAWLVCPAVYLSMTGCPADAREFASRRVHTPVSYINTRLFQIATHTASTQWVQGLCLTCITATRIATWVHYRASPAQQHHRKD